MPFIPITGVNHHYQNILFGFALVRDETEASYKWVLRTWLEAVDNKPPRTIITYQDIALGNVIAETEFNACVYKSLTATEFEGRWEPLVEKYGLEDHAWLNDMYAIRTQWIGAYMKQHFSVGMTTTSRNEFTNSFFDEYVQLSTDLKEFIENSQKALEIQYLKEVKADYDTEQLERRLVCTRPWKCMHPNLHERNVQMFSKGAYEKYMLHREQYQK
ncbi:protein FAR1-RELATED SEQUENCE 5-like [Apium graveolens]|uniref:protein FAR1-RELATED SEQUENCE 5-like n=1 Tax=Apium graveolens TaxID=4045 RepID=UPI003D7BFD70